jgi:hypothetical protein
MNKTMHLTNEPLQLEWLAAQLDDQKAVLGQLIRSVMSFGPQANLNSAQNKKLLSLLVQVADEREKESGLIYRIEQIEKMHKFAREEGKLLKTSDVKPNPQAKLEDEPKMERPGMKLLWAIILWHLFTSAENTQK